MITGENRRYTGKNRDGDMAGKQARQTWRDGHGVLLMDRKETSRYAQHASLGSAPKHITNNPHDMSQPPVLAQGSDKLTSYIDTGSINPHQELRWTLRYWW